jgi:SAM-dependent methyltransferase
MNRRSQVKHLAETVLPMRAMDSLLSMWRFFYWRRRKSINPRRNRDIIKSFLTSGRPIKLELGSAKRPDMEEWIASDITGDGDITLDLTQPIPFPDNSVELIYSSHVLEHFSYPTPMIELLRECHRILKVGGTFSLAVPDARIFLDAYGNPGSFDKARFCSLDVGLSYKSKIDYVNFIAYMGGEHRHLFDEENLVLVLVEAGFRDVGIRAFDPEVDLMVRRHESIYAQAVK